MITLLKDAIPVTCGGKAATLATLLRHGIPAPDGFVVPFAAFRAASESTVDISEVLSSEVTECLAALGDPPVAVRSSAANEDGADASAAGQYESVLGVRGTHQVIEAIRTCQRSASAARVAGYWEHVNASSETAMAVLVQRLVDAEVSGVMFTPAEPGQRTRIEASWGLGPSVVEGTVTPDTYEVGTDGSITSAIADKPTRLDRDDTGIASSPVPQHQRTRPALSADTIAALASLGLAIAAILGAPQDIEWAVSGDRLWILQARPITAPVPALRTRTPATGLSGTPGSHGTATGPARLLRGPADFPRAATGDIIVCPYTDPAWTPLFRVAAGVITETGGTLSHAAIVAREHGIPAVLGIPNATNKIREGEIVTVNGTTGTVITAHR